MKRYLNASRIQRNHNTGRFMVFSGLAVLAGGFIYSLNNREEVTLVLALALLGTLTAQFGIAMLNRWGRSPRQDERIDAALKGLDDRWTTLHYAGPTNHVLFGPAGVFAVVPRTEEGEIRYEREKWIQDRPSGGLFRRGGERTLGGIEREAHRAAGNTKVLLDKHLESEEAYDPQSLLLFLSDDVQLDMAARSAPLNAVHYKKVKDWLRRQPNALSPPPEIAGELATELGLESPESG